MEKINVKEKLNLFLHNHTSLSVSDRPNEFGAYHLLV